MTQDRDAIIEALRKYFQVKELVCPHCLAKWGEKSWQFLDTNLLHCLLILRETVIAKPMIVNGSGYTQRGLRCNMCAIVEAKQSIYLSPHIMGKAVDFTVRGMTAEAARTEIKKHGNLFPCKVRIERGKSWTHFDVLPQYGIKDQVYEFNG